MNEGQIDVKGILKQDVMSLCLALVDKKQNEGLGPVKKNSLVSACGREVLQAQAKSYLICSLSNIGNMREQ